MTSSIHGQCNSTPANWDHLYELLQQQCKPELQPMPQRVRPFTSTATPIYVDPGVTGPGTGTASDPYKYLAPAMTSVASGGMVLVRAGTTATAGAPGALYINVSGTSATSAVVIGVYDNATKMRLFNQRGAATIDCTGTANNAFYMNDRQWVCVDGLRFINKPVGSGSFICFTGTSGNNQILNCVSENSTWHGFSALGTTGGDVIEGCAATGNVDGIGIEAGANVDNYNVSINYNFVAGCNTGIKIYQTANSNQAVIAGNGIESCETYGIRVQAVSAATKIFGNYLFKSGGIVLEDQGAGANFSGSLVESNTVVRSTEFGVHIGVQGTWLVQSNRIYLSGSFDGSNPARSTRYGRGIELYGRNGSLPASSGTCRFNVLAGSYNFGGVNHNGTEGVGLACDNDCQATYVHSNICVDNEGNGIQVYANLQNVIAGNLVVNNCLAPTIRGNAWATNHKAQIVVNEAPQTQVVNNTIVCKAGENQLYGIANPATGNANGGFHNNLIIGASAIGIVKDTSGTAPPSESHNVIEASPIAVSNTSLAPISNGTGTIAVSMGGSGAAGPFHVPAPGGVCDGTGATALAQLLSIVGVPLAGNTPIGACRPA